MQYSTRWSRRPSLYFLLAFSLFLLAAASGQAQSQPNSTTVALHEGLVLDGDRSTVYLMNPRGGIDAVDVESGELRWTNPDAAKPLWISDGRLVAQAEPGAPSGALDIVALDLGAGATTFRTQVNLPTGIRGGIDDQLGKSFSVRAEPLGADVVLSWTARERPIQGTAKPIVQTLAAEPVRKAARDVEGSLKLDLASGTVQPFNQRKAIARQSRLLELNAESGIPGVDGRQFLSVDGRHVLVSESLFGQEADRLNYRWTLYSRETGGFLGEIERTVSATPFLIVDSQLLIATLPHVRRDGDQWIDEPLKLRSVDLQTGRELWSRDLRDTTYRGPFPP